MSSLETQTQEFALQPAALTSIDDYKKYLPHQAKVQECIKKALEYVGQSTDTVNARAKKDREQYERKASKAHARGEPQDEEVKRRHEEYQQKVENLTQKMDMSIRQVIDDQIWFQDIPSALDHVKQKSANVRRLQTSTPTTTQQSNDGMDVDDEQEYDEEQPVVRPDASHAPTALLDAAFSTNEAKWHAQTLTDRYSKHSDYVVWKSGLHDAQHDGDVSLPPMPHASMWFAREENRHTSNGIRGSQRGGKKSTKEDAETAADSDSEVEIAAERISTKCPITLRTFEDPVASTKCPHAFEKAAIHEMFKHTTDRMSLTTEQQLELSQINRPQDRAKRDRELRMPMVRCPECTVPLTENDLRPDPVLLRRVKRIQEKERHDQEAENDVDDIMDADEDEDDRLIRGSQRRHVVHLGSSPARSVRRQSGRVVKSERRSVIPQTQLDEDDE